MTDTNFNPLDTLCLNDIPRKNQKQLLPDYDEIIKVNLELLSNSIQMENTLKEKIKKLEAELIDQSEQRSKLIDDNIKIQINKQLKVQDDTEFFMNSYKQAVQSKMNWLSIN